MREKRLHRFYLNGKDAYRLILPVTAPAALRRAHSDDSSDSASTDEPYEEDEWEDVGRIIRLRRKVATLRAAKFMSVWENEEAEGASSR
jgi:peptide alpha-N-acetyltransferase